MANDIDDGGPVIPTLDSIPYSSGTGGQVFRRGLSIRDYFAAAALQGVITACDKFSEVINAATAAKKAYEIADAMLKARKS
jgi:hypothetical protein